MRKRHRVGLRGSACGVSRCRAYMGFAGLLAFAMALAATPSALADVTYVYDPAGRLDQTDFLYQAE